MDVLRAPLSGLMPDGRTHDQSSVLGAMALGGVAFGLTRSPETAGDLAAGMAISGVYLSLDLDILGNKGLASAVMANSSALMIRRSTISSPIERSSICGSYSRTIAGFA